MSDHKGAALILPGLPPARELIGDRGYDSNRFRAALGKRGITPCIPSTRSRKVEIPYDKALSPAASHREYPRPPQGLAPHRYSLRSLRTHILLRHLHRSDHHILARIVSPDPSRRVLLTCDRYRHHHFVCLVGTGGMTRVKSVPNADEAVPRVTVRSRPTHRSGSPPIGEHSPRRPRRRAQPDDQDH